MEEVLQRLQGSFVEVRSMVNRHDVEIISLRQAAVSVPALTLEPAGKLPLRLYSGERSTLPKRSETISNMDKRAWYRGRPDY